MDKAKVNYDRHIRIGAYKKGDLVLCSHPKIKKGLSRGLAPRFYGPFVIVGIYDNGCDYLIKRVGQAKSKVRQVHINNLKLYFKQGHPDENAIAETIELSQTQTKRSYQKNPLNARWSVPIEITERDILPSESDLDERQTKSNEETDRFESDAESVKSVKKVKRPYKKTAKSHSGAKKQTKYSLRPRKQ